MEIVGLSRWLNTHPCIAFASIAASGTPVAGLPLISGRASNASRRAAWIVPTFTGGRHLSRKGVRREVGTIARSAQSAFRQRHS